MFLDVCTIYLFLYDNVFRCLSLSCCVYITLVSFLISTSQVEVTLNGHGDPTHLLALGTPLATTSLERSLLISLRTMGGGGSSAIKDCLWWYALYNILFFFISYFVPTYSSLVVGYNTHNSWYLCFWSR